MSKKIHRITARDASTTQADEAKAEAKLDKKEAKREQEETAKKSKKQMPKWLAVVTWPFRMLAKPFIALGRYIHDSWVELRQVRWPSRGATWQMFLAIIFYSALIMGLIALLDMFFTWLFNLIIG